MSELDVQIIKSRLALSKGGAGSGNFGHAGRPGQVGGSAPGDGGSETGLSQKAVSGVFAAMTDRANEMSVEYGEVDFTRGYKTAMTDLRAKVKLNGNDARGLKNSVRELKGKHRTMSSVHLKNSKQRDGYKNAILDFADLISEGG